MKNKFLKLAERHGTPLLILDHKIIRENYRIFNKLLPRIQVYYAIKANSNQKIIKTLFNEGASFDVASYNEFIQVFNYIKKIQENERKSYIMDKIIFSNTIKDKATLIKIRKYNPLMTFDNYEELKKIKETCDVASLVLRLNVPDVGSQVEMSSKFGADPVEGAKLIKEAHDMGLNVKGLSFHVGSQCVNFDNYIIALTLTSDLLNDCRKKGYNLNLVDIGGGFPVTYDHDSPSFENLAKILNFEMDRLFPKDIRYIAEPGRFIVATAATLVSEIIGKSKREGKIYYHINDGVYHTYSGVVYDHWIPNFDSFKDGDKKICAVVGPTCDSFDKISLSANLPENLGLGDYIYTENIGAYSIASSTHFNGFDGAKIIHIY